MTEKSKVEKTKKDEKVESPKKVVDITEQYDIPKLPVQAKLALARDYVNKINIPKSGYNDFANGYHYHELGDFMPFIIEACVKFRIAPIFNYFEGYTGTKESEMAKLEVLDWDSENSLLFSSKSAPFFNKKMQEIQELGSRHTFMKRYLYMHAFEISESSPVELLQQGEDVKKNIEEMEDKIDKRQENPSTPKTNRKVSAKQLKAMGEGKGFSPEDILIRHEEETGESVSTLEKLDNKYRVKYFDRIKKS